MELTGVIKGREPSYNGNYDLLAYLAETSNKLIVCDAYSLETLFLVEGVLSYAWLGENIISTYKASNHVEVYEQGRLVASCLEVVDISKVLLLHQQHWLCLLLDLGMGCKLYDLKTATRRHYISKVKDMDQDGNFSFSDGTRLRLDGELNPIYGNARQPIRGELGIENGKLINLINKKSFGLGGRRGEESVLVFREANSRYEASHVKTRELDCEFEEILLGPGHYIACSQKNTVMIWHRGKMIVILSHKETVLNMAWHPTLPMLAILTDNPSLLLAWDPRGAHHIPLPHSSSSFKPRKLSWSPSFLLISGQGGFCIAIPEDEELPSAFQ